MGHVLPDTRNKNLNMIAAQPEGILVVGRLSELEQDEAKLRTFDLFRKSLHNTRILTFDELLARARFVVETEELTAEELVRDAVQPTTSGDYDPDEIPF